MTAINWNLRHISGPVVWLGAPVPNEYLSKLVMFLVPWQTIGFEYFGKAVYLSVFLCLLDLNFWPRFALALKVNRRHIGIVLCAISLAAIFVIRAQGELEALIKLVVFSLYCCYLYYSFKSWGYTSLRHGFLLACLLSIVQFVEVNFFGLGFFNMRNFLWKIGGSFNLGVGTNLGGSYDVNGILSGVTRVSGSAMEPGHFCAVLVAYLPFLRKNKKEVALFCFAFVACLSKISLLYALTLPIGLIAMKLLKFRASSVLVMYCSLYFIIGNIFLGLFESRLDIFRWNNSVYSRIESVFLFDYLALAEKLFGTGYRRICEFVPARLFSFSITENTPFVDLGSGSPTCIAGVNSSFGSLVLENGIVGAFFIFTIMSKSFEVNSKLRVVVHRQLTRRRFNEFWGPGECVLLFFIANQGLHYFTSYPCLAAVLALGAIRKEGQFG